MHIVIDARIRRASTGRPVDRLLQYLQTIDTKNRYSILVELDDPWKPTSRKFQAVPCRFKRFSFNPLQQLLFAVQIYRLKPDLVHFMMTGHQPIFYFGRQITFTHDLTMFDYVRAGRLPLWAHKLRMIGYRFLFWQSHRKAKKIIVPTEYVRDAVYKRYLFTRRKIVVTLEASEPPLKAEAIKPLDAPDDFIMYVGSAFPHKNLEKLVEAFGLLREQFPKLKLLLVGKQEYHSKQLQKWVNTLDYASDVIFTGFVSDEELKWLYTHVSLYVFPSLSEGFGLPPLEAMAHGCPVASSNATCIPEVCGDAAEYFNPNDSEEIARMVSALLKSKSAREKLVAKGYLQIKKYSWERMALETEAVYDSVLGSSS